MVAHVISQGQGHLIPGVLIIQHFIPRGLLVRVRVIPLVETSAQAQADAAEKVVAGPTVEIPHGQFQDFVHEFFLGDVAVDEAVVPFRVQVLLHHCRFLLGFFAFVRKQIAGK